VVVQSNVVFFFSLFFFLSLPPFFDVRYLSLGQNTRAFELHAISFPFFPRMLRIWGPRGQLLLPFFFSFPLVGVLASWRCRRLLD